MMKNMQSFALLLPVVVGAALLLSVLLVSFQRQNSVEITAAHRNEQHYSAESAVAVVFSSSADLHVLTSHSSLRPQRKLYPSVTRHGKDPAPFQLPLPLCGGDCDTNEECDEGLVCWQRSAGDPLPGCNLGQYVHDGTDYCIPVEVATVASAAAKQGDVAIQQEQAATERIGEENSIPTLEFVGSFAEEGGFVGDVFPLANCQGDCDLDEECEDGLMCYYRIRDEPVPGCSGSPETGVDYCVKREYVMPDTEDDETDPPTKAPVTSNHNNSVMPEKDVGDAEEETSGSVVNMAQDAPTQAPTFEFRGPPSSAAPTSTYYSMMLQNFSEPQPLQFVGNDGDFDAYPLGPCQGDCDEDADCLEGLKCFQRIGGEDVPGCYGTDRSSNDYCVFAENLPNQTKSWQHGFRMKLYWEEGYKWQNETFERRWCITYDYQGSTQTGGKCWYGDESLPCNPDGLYVSECSLEHLPAPNQLFDFFPVSSDEVMIQAYGDDRCMERARRHVTMMPCNATIENQRWFAVRGGFNERRFELSQKRVYDYCLNQQHHPKPGEVLRMQSCERARMKSHETSWWDLY